MLGGIVSGLSEPNPASTMRIIEHWHVVSSVFLWSGYMGGWCEVLRLVVGAMYSVAWMLWDIPTVYFMWRVYIVS